jgi:hypothetical protein
MAERPRDIEAVDQPEPEDVLPTTPRPAADHEPTDAEDRPVELDEPEQPEPPIDDEDRDPARRERDRPGG